MSARITAGNKMSGFKKKTIRGRVLYGRSNRTNISNTSRSFSQSMITKAVHKSRIKSLLHNNKALAKTLEFTQCDLVHKEKMITNLQQALNHHMVLRLKVREMSQTAKKLIEEVQDVVNYLDCEMIGKPPEASQTLILARKRSLGQDFDAAFSAESLEPNDSDCIHNETATDSLPIVEEVSASDDICTTPKIQSSLIMKQRLEAQNKERRIGICDLTAINEVSLVADDPTLPPLLFIDDDDTGKRTSLRNNGKSPEVVGKTPELFISPYMPSKKSQETKGRRKSQTNVRKSNRASICGKISDTASKAPSSSAISKATKIPRKIKSPEKAARVNKMKSSSSQVIEENCDATVDENKGESNEEQQDTENRRGTFVVSSANNTVASKSNKRGTFVVNNSLKSPEKECLKKTRATFVIPCNPADRIASESALVPTNKETESEDRRATFVKISSNKPDATSHIISSVSEAVKVSDVCRDNSNDTASSKANDVSDTETVAVPKDVTPPAFNQTVLLHEDMELTGVLNILPNVIKELHAQQPIAEPMEKNESPEIDVENGNLHINKKNQEKSTDNQNACVDVCESSDKVVIQKDKEHSVVALIEIVPSIDAATLPINKEKKEQDNNKTSKKKNDDGLSNRRDKKSLKTAQIKKTLVSTEIIREKAAEIPESRTLKSPDSDDLNKVIESQRRENSFSFRYSTRLRKLPKKSYAVEEIDLDLDSESDKDTDSDFFFDEDPEFDAKPCEEKFKRKQGEKQKKFVFTSKRKLQSVEKVVSSEEEIVVLEKLSFRNDEECENPEETVADSLSKKRKSIQFNVNTKRKKTSHRWNDILSESDSDSDFCFGVEHSKKPKKKSKKAVSTTDRNQECADDNFSNPSGAMKNHESKGYNSSKSKKEENKKTQQRKFSKKNFELGSKMSYRKMDENECDNSKKHFTANENTANLIFEDKPESACKENPGSSETVKENVNDKADVMENSELMMKSSPKKVVKEKKTKTKSSIVQTSGKLATKDADAASALKHKKSTKKFNENLKATVKDNCDKENQVTVSSTITVQAEINKQIPDVLKGKSLTASVEQNMQPVVVLRDTFASIKNVLASDYNPNELEKSSDNTVSRKTSSVHSKLSICSLKPDATDEECHIVRTTNEDDDFARPSRRSRNAVSYKEPKINIKMRRIK